MKNILAALLVLASCADAPKKDEKRDALSATHRELFEFMGLSKPAVEELCGKVEWVYDGIQKHKHEMPAAMEPSRGNPKSYDEAMAAHGKRFDGLGLTPATKKELGDAFTVVYNDLRTPNPSERALKIRDLMKSLPPCCDDNIFKRAGAAP